jgi:hypothetical protein
MLQNLRYSTYYITRYIFLTLLILLTSLASKSKIPCKINGRINDPSIFRYACLYISKTKKLTLAPIINNEFHFNLSRQQDDVLGILFLGIDSLPTIKDVKENGVAGYYQSRMIALENMDICIDENMSDAMVYGGNLTNDLEQMNNSTRNLDFKPFFEQHPDSPIAMILLKSLTVISKKPIFAAYVDCKSYFNDLSDRLKNSAEGKEVWAKINEQVALQ